MTGCGPSEAYVHRSPGCRQRKHTSCTGDAWCDLDDTRADCSCTCHRGGA